MQEAIDIMSRRFLNACWSIGWQGSPAQSVRAARVAFRALRDGSQAAGFGKGV